MQIDDPIVVTLYVALLGAGWKWVQSWMRRVDMKLDAIAGQPERCAEKFVTQDDCDRCNRLLWDTVHRLEERFHAHETSSAAKTGTSS